MSETTTEPVLGDLLQADVATDRYAFVRQPSVDARNAAAMTLAAYLKRVVFVVGAGEDGQTVSFQLNDVLEEWPESFEELDYPVAAITGIEHPLNAHSFTPTMLEETFERYCPGTVLWKTAELAMVFQVDFWANDKPTREAIAARLPDVFSPTEARSGIMVQGPKEYFDLPVRFELQHLARPDNSNSVYNRERELRAMVAADLDVVHLRQAGLLQPAISIDGDPVNVKELSPLGA